MKLLESQRVCQPARLHSGYKEKTHDTMGSPLVEISDTNAWAITLSLNTVALFSIVYLRSIGVLEKLFSRKLMVRSE